MSDTLALLALMNKGEGLTEEQVNQVIDSKNLQPKLTAGENITISEDNVISAIDTDTAYFVDYDTADYADIEAKIAEGKYPVMKHINYIMPLQIHGSDYDLFACLDGTAVKAVSISASTKKFNSYTLQKRLKAGEGINIDPNTATISATNTGISEEQVNTIIDSKNLQPKLTAGTNITIENNVISSTDTGLNETEVNTLIDNKNLQPKLTAGDNITISENNVISATSSGGGSSYTFSNGLTETDGNVTWDLNGNIYKIDNTDKMVIIPDKSSNDGKLIIKTDKGLPDSSLYVTGQRVVDVEFGYNSSERNIIQGARSLVVGYSNQCYPQSSVMLGTGLTNFGAPQCSTFLGAYNDDTNLSDKILVIGNGAWNSKSNALTVDTSGNLVCNNIPAAPTTDGNYVLKCSIVSGVPTYSWVAEQ